MAIIDIMEAAIHLRLDTSDEQWEIGDEALDLAKKLAEAEDIVLDFIKYRTDIFEGSDDSTAPGRVSAAIKVVLSDLWEHRAGGGDDVVLSPSVKSMLKRLRHPTLA